MANNRFLRRPLSLSVRLLLILVFLIVNCGICFNPSIDGEVETERLSKLPCSETSAHFGSVCCPICNARNNFVVNDEAKFPYSYSRTKTAKEKQEEFFFSGRSGNREEKQSDDESVDANGHVLFHILKAFSRTFRSGVLQYQRRVVKNIVSSLGSVFFIGVSVFVQIIRTFFSTFRASEIDHKIHAITDRIQLYYDQLDIVSWKSFPDFCFNKQTKNAHHRSTFSTESLQDFISKLNLSQRLKEKRKKAFDWVFGYRGTPCSDVDVYTNTAIRSLSLQRLASFRQLPQTFIDQSVHVTVLSDAGFAYTGREDLVKCEGCNNVRHLKEVVVSPRSIQFHKQGCTFVEDDIDTDSEVVAATAQATGQTYQNATAAPLPRGPESQLFEESQTHNFDSHAFGKAVLNETPQRLSAQYIHGAQAVNKMTKNGNLEETNVEIFRALISSVERHCSEAQTSIREIPSADMLHQTSESFALGKFPNEAVSLIDADSGTPVSAEDSESNLNTETLELATNTLPHSSHIDEDPGYSSDNDGHQSERPVSHAERPVSQAERPVSQAERPVSQPERPAQTSTEQPHFHPHNESLLDDLSIPYNDGHLFDVEIKKGSKNPFRGPTKMNNICLKCPGNLSYAVSKASEDNLPPFFRCSEMAEYISLVSVLTVRLVVKTPRDPGTIGSCRFPAQSGRESASASKRSKYLYGTGSAILEFSDFESTLGQHKKEEQTASGTIDQWKQRLNHFRKGKSATESKPVLIATSSHLISTDEEAASTTVEFTFDSNERSKVVSIKGWMLHDSRDLLGEHTCLLLCWTSEEFSEKLRSIRGKLQVLERRFPEMVKQFLLNSVIVPSHPHGRSKVVSFGDKMNLFYKLKRRNGLQELAPFINPNLVYESNLSTIRKTLIYTTETCFGSSGAPVLAFRKTGADMCGKISIAMDLWIHQGVDKTFRLNGCALKLCTSQDFPSQQTQQSNGRHETVGFSNQPYEIAANKMADSSHLAVDNPNFASYGARLSSFADWPPGHFLSPQDLAKRGFYYAGYKDCVRCFCCGLGLRGWLEGDDPDLEHWNREPGCFSFDLTSTPRPIIGGPNMAAISKSELEKLKRKLVAKEHAILKEMFVCKACHSAKVKDVFLPCSHLCVCADCGLKLTHCPVCGTAAQATVTTFFA